MVFTKRRQFAAFFFTTLCAAPLLSLAQTDTIGRSEDDLAIVDLRLGTDVLAEGVPSYVTKTGLLLPLKETAEALQLQIKVSPKDGQADGWILDEANTFSLDVLRHEVTIAGSRDSFAPELAELHDGDIYVDISLLSKWFGVAFNFSFAAQVVDIATPGGLMLPVQRLAAREKRLSELVNRRPKSESPVYNEVREPYSLYTTPFADINASLGYDQRNPDRQAQFTTSALISQDLLYMNSNLYFNIEEKDLLTNLRWTLSRKDPDGKLFADDEAFTQSGVGEWFNNLEVRDLSLGDIFTPQLPLTATNQNGRGVLISNQPLNRATQFNRTTIDGNIQPGWEVELYRNDELLTFQRTTETGRYEFVDVPLLNGLNIIRLVFYGPYGQTREEVRRLMVNPEITKEGESFFRLSLSEQAKNLVETRDQANLSSFSTTIPNERELTEGKERLTFEYEYGVFDNLALFAQAAHLPTGDGGVQDYITGGFGTVLADTYTRLDFSQAADGGNAVRATAQSNIWGVNISAESRYYNNFISDFTESVSDPIISHSYLRTDMPLKLPWLPRLYSGFNAEYIIYDSGRERLDTSSRLAGVILGRASFAHTLRFLQDRINGNMDRRQQSELVLSAPIGRILLRGSSIYTITPESELDSLAASAEYRLTPRMQARLDIDHRAADDSFTSYTASLNHRFDEFLFGVSTTYDSDSNVAVGFSVSLSLGDDPRTNKTHYFADASARDGVVSARAYLDENNNNMKEEAEQYLETAAFRVDGGSAGYGYGIDATDEASSLLRNIPTDQKTVISIDAQSLEEPYIVPANDGARTVARSGVPIKVDIPIIHASDVEGMVRFAGKRGDNGAANVIVQIVNLNGKVVRETKTAFDGYYMIDLIPAGNYTVQLSPEQLERRGYRSKKIHDIVIDGTQDIIEKIDFDIRK